MNDNKDMPQHDHDLLIRLDTKMDRAAEDIKAVDRKVSDVSRDLGVMADGLEDKIAAAVADKEDKSRVNELKAEGDKIHDDHERRIRSLERYVWSAIGALTLAQIAMAIFK